MSDLGVGDSEIPFLDVTPHDGTTVVTLTVTPPSGPEIPLTTTGGDATGPTRRYTANGAVTYNLPAWWVLNWTVTGTGAGKEPQRKYAVPSPTAGGPTWTPSRSKVATYVPGRALRRTATDHQLTFDSTTYPRGIQVDGLIADGVSWVLLVTGDIHASLTEAATATAAVYAAAMVEQGYPDREAIVRENAIDTAAALWRQAQSMRGDLQRANEAKTGSDPMDPGNALLPSYSFPPAPNWGDVDL